MRKCKKCGEIKQETLFRESLRGESSICDDCIKDSFSYDDTGLYLGILKELDMPFISSQWERLRRGTDKNYPLEPYRTLFIYIGTMKLAGYKHFSWADSAIFNESEKEVT